MLERRRRLYPEVLVAVISGACLITSPVTAAVDAKPRVLGSFPHDSAAFTQGLLLHCGAFFESTGLYGESSLRRVNPTSGEVIQSAALSPEVFGEGLALVGERLIQLTWKEEVAFVYDSQSFELQNQFEYEGEGWGLCHDGQNLVMSNGSSELQFRDPGDFELLSTVRVIADGDPVANLNELECVDAWVFANVWQTDRILQIEASSGEVVASFDASGLLSVSEARVADVLNGIAYDPASGHFFITGKLWPKMFEVELSAPGVNGPHARGAAFAREGCADAGPIPQVEASASTLGDAATGHPPRAEPRGGCGVTLRSPRSGGGPWILLGTLLMAGLSARRSTGACSPARHHRSRGTRSWLLRRSH